MLELTLGATKKPMMLNGREVEGYCPGDLPGPVQVEIDASRIQIGIVARELRKLDDREKKLADLEGDERDAERLALDKEATRLMRQYMEADLRFVRAIIPGVLPEEAGLLVGSDEKRDQLLRYFGWKDDPTEETEQGDPKAQDQSGKAPRPTRRTNTRPSLVSSPEAEGA